MKFKYVYPLIWIIVIALCMGTALVSATDYRPHERNTDLEFSVTSNNATLCNVTTLESPTGISVINLPMTKNFQDFYITINAKNFTTLGDYCFNIECSNSLTSESGSVCRNVTPSGNNGTSNIAFIIFIIAGIYAVGFIGFFGRNEIVALIGGMFMVALGVYIVTNGIIIYQDYITNYFAYITLGLGAFFSISSAISLIEE